MIFLQFKGTIYYHINLPKKRIIMPKFNPKMSLSVYSIFSFPVNFLFFVSLVKKTTPPILSYPRFRVQFNTYIIHLSKTSTDNQFMYLKADSLFL